MTASSTGQPGTPDEHISILGIPFFTGSADEAVDRMMRGGLLVVPAAPALKDLSTDEAYRSAILGADLVLPDSAFMVLLWNLIERQRLRRLSGLEYLRALLRRAEMRAPASTLWVMAGEASSAKNRRWLAEQGIAVPESHVYLAPIYARAAIADPGLLALIHTLRPRHVIVTVGGGTQERLGLFLRQNLDFLPGIHCIGAAIAFLSGDQVGIPVWADRFYLGWLLRTLDDPRRYGPRYWSATRLASLLLRYRRRLPPLRP